jgi:hypothetical protein
MVHPSHAITMHAGLLEGPPFEHQVVAIMQPQRKKPILLAKELLQGLIIKIAGTFRQPSFGP